LCECGQCTAPSQCDPSPNVCVNVSLNPVVRRCESTARQCATAICQVTSCNATTGCQLAPVVCHIYNDTCFVSNCQASSGVCVTRCAVSECSTGPTGVGPCASNFNCFFNSECNDNNSCTNDVCDQITHLCSNAPVVCPDSNPCTFDFCDQASGCQHLQLPDSICDDGIECTSDTCNAITGCDHSPRTCNDGLGCTTDSCDFTLGRCVYDPIICPTSNDNCTLNFCLFAGCTQRYLCPNDLISAELSDGAKAGIAVAAIVGAAALAVAGYVTIRIVRAPKVKPSGGSAADFAAD